MPAIGSGEGISRKRGRTLAALVQDVMDGCVTQEGARDYGVVVRFGGENDLVRLPGEWVIDEAATAELRKKR